MNLKLPKNSKLIYSSLPDKGLRFEFKRNAPAIAVIAIAVFLLMWFGIVAALSFGQGTPTWFKLLSIPFWIVGIAIATLIAMMVSHKESLDLYPEFLVYKQKRLFLKESVKISFYEILDIDRSYPSRIQRVLENKKNGGKWKDQVIPIKISTENKAYFWFHQLQETDINWLFKLLHEIWSKQQFHLLH